MYNPKTRRFPYWENKKAKEQLLRKHDLVYFEEPSSLLDAIEMFYEGIDTFSSILF